MVRLCPAGGRLTIRTMGIDDAVALLSAALGALDFRMPRPPESTRDIDDLAAEIAPLRLPDEIRRFWELVDTSTLVADRPPKLDGPRYALHSWKTHHSPGFPEVLLPIGHESWSLLMVELHGPSDTLGGPLVEWAYGDQDFRYVAESLADWVAETAVAVRGQRFERSRDRDGVELALLEHIIRPPDHRPGNGGATNIPVESSHWPGRWRNPSTS